MSRKARGKDWLGAGLIALALAGLAAAGAALILLRPPPTDPESLCRTDRPLAAHTIVLVDATDKLAPRHRKRLEAAVAQERARLAPYDRLTILALRPDQPREPRVLFSRCLPRDARLANPLYENPKQLQARWEESVGRALKTALRRASAAGPAAASPIAEAAAAVAADPDFAGPGLKRRFVLISDLLEHQPGGFSLYRDGAAYADYAKAHAPAALMDAAVRVVPLDRPDQAARQAAARAFWTTFFTDAGATQVAWDPIG